MFITEEKERVRTADVAENFGSSSRGCLRAAPESSNLLLRLFHAVLGRTEAMAGLVKA